MQRSRVCVLLLTTCLLLLSALVGGPSATAGSTSNSLIGRQAPAFALKDFEGHTIRLSQYRGKVILLNFWASWCAPCQAEMPEFSQWQTSFGGKLQMLGISMDDDLSQARAAAHRLRITYPLLAGTQQVGQAYGGIFGLPETFLIGPKGRVRAEFQGANHLNEIHAAIEHLIQPAQ